MRLTGYTEYSLRMLIYLATKDDGLATIAEVARSYGISEHHLTKVAHHPVSFAMGAADEDLVGDDSGGSHVLGKPFQTARHSTIITIIDGGGRLYSGGAPEAA
jgi:hypothetical protein